MIALAERPALPGNACQHAGQPGHVESYFLRANDPARPRALWLKATILAPLSGEPVAESWLVWFDGEAGKTYARRETQPLHEAAFGADGARVRAGRLELGLGPAGEARGEVGGAKVALRFERERDPAAGTLSPFPLQAMYGAPFPRFKLLTPESWLRFSGELSVEGEQVSLDGWTGMQGHNWGREHSQEYAWGQCVFPARGAEPSVVAEGFTGRIKVAGRVTPPISALVVRRGGEELRFDRLLDLWRQEARVDRDRWELRLFGPGGEARLSMDAAGRPMACLGYRNPTGKLSYCFNSKLARAALQVQPRRGPAFECHSEHGGALEFLRPVPDPRFPEVV